METREIKFRAWVVSTTGAGQLNTPRMDYAPNDVIFSWDADGVGMYIMQFTGLKDKNGKEIYEGDILREPSKSEWDDKNFACYEVFFHDGDAHLDYNIGFTMNRSYFHGVVCGGYVPPFKPNKVSNMIVIGNIHENPELLTK